MSNWEIVKINDIGKVVTGKTPRTDDSLNYGSDFMFLGPTDLHKHFIITESEKMISSKGLASIKGSKLDGLSILVGCIGWDMGNVALVNCKCATNQQINSITEIKESYNPLYIYYWLKHKKNYLFQIANVTRTPILNKSDFSNIELSVPNKMEQDKIAKVLSDLDAKIEINNRINSELEAMAKTLYDYWFVQFDFPDANGKPYKTAGGKMVWNDELKREIPEGWESGELKDLFNLNPPLSVKKGAVSSYIDMNALPTEGYMTKAVQEKEFSGGVKFQNGDVIVARITPCLENGKTGLITLLEEDEIGFGSTEFIVLRGKNMILSCFGAFLSRSELFRKYAIANMLGTSGRKRVEATKIGTFPIALPTIDLLEKFEKMISAHFKQATINTKENQELASLRDWLLPMLMNGQVSVGDVAEELGMVAEEGELYGK